MKLNSRFMQDSVWYQSKGFKVGLLLAITLQLTVLVVEYLGSVWPIWTGTPIVLKTQPYDPRSLFRGNFVRLSYELNQVESDNASDYKLGSIVYVSLKEDLSHWRFDKLSKLKPETGLFLRGRVRANYNDSLSIEYGIEAFFMPKEKALLAQETLRQGALMRIFVSNSGKARALEFVCQGDAC
ncbi:putative membrane-anchored protein [Shewanella psychrophila]|uniref:Putative membrane-anchored protein n=1 Tax=Shewanella psychrophila TaxID=225848 RepID=A0A1S6HK92_9GAMM|nr:GDYXXLXY domain-containing protein [Shewanella psychrophila]AQS35955.1 putative membrane-anchored protein [Shewanella psychrophila]